jgi:hypothetical protein
MQGRMNDVAAIVNFLGQEKPTFTIKSVASGKHFTYKIGKGKFVSVLSGPDNTADYSYMGMIDQNRTKVVTTRASQFSSDSQAFKALNWTLGQMAKGSMPESVEFYHEGKCSHCGRVLTTPESVASGIGPVCGRRI